MRLGGIVVFPQPRLDGRSHVSVCDAIRGALDGTWEATIDVVFSDDMAPVSIQWRQP